MTRTVGPSGRIVARTAIGLAIFAVGAAFFLESFYLGAMGNWNASNLLGILGWVMMPVGLFSAALAAWVVDRPRLPSWA